MTYVINKQDGELEGRREKIGRERNVIKSKGEGEMGEAGKDLNGS